MATHELVTSPYPGIEGATQSCREPPAVAWAARIFHLARSSLVCRTREVRLEGSKNRALSDAHRSVSVNRPYPPRLLLDSPNSRRGS